MLNGGYRLARHFAVLLHRHCQHLRCTTTVRCDDRLLIRIRHPLDPSADRGRAGCRGHPARLPGWLASAGECVAQGVLADLVAEREAGHMVESGVDAGVDAAEAG